MPHPDPGAGAPTAQRRPVLDGIRVVELASYIAAPTAGRILAAYGAEVIKVERPGAGDEVRRWHTNREETSLLWRSVARNKKSMTLDWHDPEGRGVLLDLVRHADVLLDGFRPGALERAGLDPKVLAEVNPELVLVRVSGFGQSGPYRDQAGFGSVAEAIGGLRYLTGYPDRPPTRVGISLGDSVAGIHAALGAVLALLARERGTGRGRMPTGVPGLPEVQVVDVALYEAVYSLLDSVVAEYQAFGVVRQRTGTSIAGIAPSNTYPCADGRFVVIGANADAVFARLTAVMGRPELATDPRYADAVGRARCAEELDGYVGRWTQSLAADRVLALLAEHGVPATPIYDATDLAGDPHFAARGTHERYSVAVGPGCVQEVGFPAPVARLSHAPTVHRWAGPELGEHTEDVLCGLLGYDEDRVGQLRATGVV
ncbi:MAG: CaiB/BaiF CoA transferase family protein [Actinomycetes bacterium]